MVKRPVGRPRKVYRAEIRQPDGDDKPKIQDDGGASVSAATPEPEPVTFDPGTVAGSAPNGTDEGERKRGRPRKKEAAEDLTALLLSLHMMLAAWTKTPELTLEPEEAEKLGKAIDRVQRLYNRAILSEETSAWVNLIFACGTIYGPRYVALRNQKKRKPSIVDIPSPRTVEERAAATVSEATAGD
jgi:hypothetical protein